jgi:RNA polymerase sigma factor (sigma-70 family)
MQAAGFAVGKASRLKPIWGYTWEDMRSDAMLGAWSARDMPYTDERHHLNLMALCGYRRILDARTVQYRANEPFEHEAGDSARHWDPACNREPRGDYSALELATHIERLPEPYPTVARLLFEGLSLAEIGEQLGVSESRVSQRRSQLQRLLKRHAIPSN